MQTRPFEMVQNPSGHRDDVLGLTLGSVVGMLVGRSVGGAEDAGAS